MRNILDQLNLGYAPVDRTGQRWISLDNGETGVRVHMTPSDLVWGVVHDRVRRQLCRRKKRQPRRVVRKNSQSKQAKRR